MLSPQQKLAVMLTSAGSQRKLASLMGVSHQKIGRWLREGVPATIDPTTGYVIHQAGAKRIPDDALPAIDYALSIHRKILVDQARSDHIPYSSEVPLYAYRGILSKGENKGKKGDRVFVDNTEYISKSNRMLWLRQMYLSGKFVKANVRSTVDFVIYTKRFVQAQRKAGYIFGTLNQQIKDSMDLFEYKHAPNAFNETTEIRKIRPIYTMHEDFHSIRGTRQSNIDSIIAVNAIEARLSAKHSPAALSGGFADKYLLQTQPVATERLYDVPIRSSKLRAPKRSAANTKSKLTRK
jgi:DNA-binding transcriptional regulator YdaS (Cro superfamily)